MKIGIFISELAPGSAPKVIGQTYKGLEKLGHRCEVLVLIDSGQSEDVSRVYEQHLSGVKIRRIFGKRPWWDFKIPGFSFFSLHHLLSFFVAPFIIRRKEFDIIIANGQFATFAAWGLKLFKGIPYIFYVHCDPCTYTLRKTYSKTWLRFLYPLIYLFAWMLDAGACSGAKAVITSGKLHAERFRGLSRRPNENLVLGCFSSEVFVPYTQREKAMLAYDRWDIGNKPEIFLKLLESCDKTVKLKLGGFWHPQGLKEDFIKEIKKRGQEGRVELLGPLNEKMILELCSKVMLHVHPNQEAFGMQTLEAAACGACIIVPSGSGVADLFEDGIQGYFPSENDFNRLSRCVNLVFSDLDKAQMMGMQARERAKDCNWENYSLNLEKILLKYAGKAGS